MTETELESRLSEPAPEDVAAVGTLRGTLAVLGASGKMGPTLARLALRAAEAAGAELRVVAISRFREPGVRDDLTARGAEAVTADLTDPTAYDRLPDAEQVVFMVGHKFGSSADPARTWATNVLAPAYAAERYAGARIVAFSTGNVYPLTPVASGGATEAEAPDPVGEYAWSALARERVLTHEAQRHRTPLALLRLNYAVEPRYGVLRDIADRVYRGEPIDLTMGHVNVIWQRDANAIALRALAHAAVPPFVLNVTGSETLAVRSLAEQFGHRFGRAPSFTGHAGTTALLSNAARCHELFGPPSMRIEAMLDAVAEWVLAGGRSLGRPTHYEEREGRF